MNEPLFLYVLLGVAFLVIVAVPVYQYAGKNRRDLFEPVYLGAFVFLLMFWFRSVSILLSGSGLLGDAPFAADLVKAWSLSWLYLLLAIVLFYWSYYSPAGPILAHAFAPLPTQWNLRRVYMSIWALLAAGAAALLALIGQFGSLAAFLFQKSEVFTTLGTGPLVLLGQCVAVSMQVAYAIVLRRKGRAARAMFVCTALAAFTAQAFLGMKGAFLILFLSLAMLRHYLHRPMRPRYVLLFALAGIFLVFPAFTALRAADDATKYQQQWAFYSEPARAFDIVAQRFSGIEALIFIVRDTPRVMDYQLGRTYLSVLVSWIPREIWPHKPILGFGQVFTPLYLGHVFTPGGTTYAPTIFGEAYVNFHIFGIILVAIGGGTFLRAFYEYSIVRERTLSGTLIYAATLPYVLVCLEAHSVAWLTPGWLFLVTRSLSSFLGQRAFGRHSATAT